MMLNGKIYHGGVTLTPLVTQDFFNDTHMEKLDSVEIFIEIQGWLLLTFFICLHNQLSSFNSIIVQMSEKRNSSNRKWLLLSVTFTAKLELVFVLTFKNALQFALQFLNKK